jgi:hypothetical protein
VGNVLEIDAADGEFDCVVVHDLFEHLSPAALERALAEVCRVAGESLCLSFFRMHGGSAHEVVARGRYYWSGLSLPRVVESLAYHGARADGIWVGELMRGLFAGAETHNWGACTLVVSKDA